MDYTELKHSDNGMPTREGFMYPLLEVASQNATWKKHDLVNEVIKQIGLPQELAELHYDSKYHDLVAEIIIGFSLSELVVSGLLKRERQGVYSITSEGREYLDKYGVNLSSTIVQNIPAYIEYQKAKKNKGKITNHIDRSEMGELEIDEWFQSKKEETKAQLINQLTQMNPYQFETLMVNLLNRMGYKGPNGQSIVTQKSNDNGIDGVIYQDALGLQKVYLQVKRYATGNSVGQPEIATFSGSVKLKHMDRGVFITTSTFTAKAYEAAKSLNIVTIDGDMLTNLMIQYRVGVEEAKTYHIYRINKDDFTD